MLAVLCAMYMYTGAQEAVAEDLKTAIDLQHYKRVDVTT
jgi:hypothetical protein